MADCAQHRAYLGAIADGESGLVPRATLDHVRTCPDCDREVWAHSALNHKLRSALGRPAAAARRSRRPWPLTVVAVAAVFLVLAGGLGTWRAVSREDRVEAAAAVSLEAPQFRSTDTAEIGAWCRTVSQRSMPEVRLDPLLRPVGARMDHRAATDIVTVRYRTEKGDEIDVAWLDATRTESERAAIQARSVAGRLVLLVTSPGGTAVVSGSAPAARLWQAAAAIERTDGSALASPDAA